jgi:hypothetical protein
MKFAILAAATALLAAGPATAQGYGVPAGPKLGEMEVKVYQGIPAKTKIAVQLTSDTHLSRELRRQVMVRIAQRGNEVGFSGGSVMRMDVTYFDLSGGTGRRDYDTQGGQPQFAAPGSNPRMDLPSNKLRPRDSIAPPPDATTLRITLTLYTVDGGKVTWMGTASCPAPSNSVQTIGEAMINRMFDNANKSIIADAGC